MQRDISKFKNTEFDILIIGGGISGAAIAWESVTRGYKTALIEKNDFGHATSMATSKLIHGGLRYLAQYDFGVVRESLRERRYLSQILPHQAFPLPFLIPIYDFTPTPGFVLGAGLKIYDLLSYDKNDLVDTDKHLSNSRLLSKEKVLQYEPGLHPKGLRYGYLYYDILNKHPERSNFDFAYSAAENGATLANYVKAERFILEESSEKNNSKRKILGIHALDTLNNQSFEIRAKSVINATGPWGDLVLSTLEKSPVRKITRSKGIHMIFPRMHKNTAITFETKDKHHFFIIPWLNYSLVGTTDTEYDGHPDDIKVLKSEVLEFIKLINDHYPGNLKYENLKHAYTGIRPLVSEENEESSYDASRRHEIIDHEKVEKLSGLYSVFGGKWTTSRALAEQTIDLIEKNRNFPRTRSVTKNHPLKTSQTGNRFSLFINDAHHQYDDLYGDKMITHLIEYYGSEYNKVLNYIEKDSSLKEPIEKRTHHIKAQILYGLENEMVQKLSDFLLRRAGFGNEGIPHEQTLNSIVNFMGDYLKWDKTRKEEEIIEYKNSQTIIDDV